jgi:hypothetical protein
MKPTTIIFPFILQLLVFSICFAELNEKKRVENPAIKAIDAEIEKLEKKLDEYQLREANETTEAQDYMIGDWPQYAQEIQDVEEYDEEGNQIEERIQELQQQKKEIIDRMPTKQEKNVHPK